MNASEASITDKKKSKARAKSGAASSPAPEQLDLFGNDDQINFVRMMDQADIASGEVLVAIEADPTILAGVDNVDAAKEALSLARFMKTEGNPDGVVREALEVIGVQPVIVLKQLKKVKAVVDVVDEVADEVSEATDGQEDDSAPYDDQLEGGSDDSEADEKDLEKIVRTAAVGMADSALGALLRRIRLDRYAPLSVEAENVLHEQCRAGSMRARDELVERNMRFLVSTARKFMYTGRDLEWLVAAGQVGLITAAVKFDPQRGRMSSCAKWWIRQSIQRELGKDNLITTPAYMQPKANRLRREAEAATTDDERIKLTEQADRLQAEIKARRSMQVSMDASVGDDDSETGTMHNFLEAECEGPEEQMDRHRLVEKLVSFAQTLPEERHRNIFLMRIGLHEDFIGEPRTLRDLAEAYNVSGERIRQIYAEAAQEIVTKVMVWAGGEDNLPDGFRKGLMTPGRG